MTWKLQIPLLRCPHCRNWVQVINRGEWKCQTPPKKLLERLRRERTEANGPLDSPASQSSYKNARAREEAKDGGNGDTGAHE